MMGREMPKKREEGRADEFDDGEEDDGVDGDPCGRGRGRCRWARCPTRPRKISAEPRGLIERKKRTEAQSEVFPDKQHGFTR